MLCGTKRIETATKGCIIFRSVSPWTGPIVLVHKTSQPGGPLPPVTKSKSKGCIDSCTFANN